MSPIQSSMAGSLEASSGGLSVSPSSSGRASPVPKRWSNFNKDDLPSKDKAFRKYASGVERSLSLFDTALQEWADYISFLGRLLKSLQARPPSVSLIPSKSMVAKRLAQSLNPSLPSGVHQKALEVYSFIFTVIGKDGLSRDLPLYLPGLASILSFASLSVRAPFLELLEGHLLHLDSHTLRPAVKAIILALLPGLEEETSEEFERTLRLLENFKAAIRPSQSQALEQNHETGDGYFWQCFFLATITGKHRRLGALTYLIRNLPRLTDSSPANNSSMRNEQGIKGLQSTRLVDIVTSPEPGLLIRCFAAGLADDQILIQRGFQDLLVSHLPLHSEVLQKHVKTEDLELLVTAAAGVVHRREMSLNRRLWTWLLGPEPPNSENDATANSPSSPETELYLHHRQGSKTKYFEEFGKIPLTRALLKLIAYDTVNPVERARPFRICLSLMDRWEIGGLVVPDIFLPIISNVQKYKSVSANKSDFAEVLRSASVFFDGVESGLIWGEILGLLTQALRTLELSYTERTERLSLVAFIISHFNIREEEMLMVHAPLTTLSLLVMLEGSDIPFSRAEEVKSQALSIAIDLIGILPVRAFQIAPSAMTHTIMNSDSDQSLYCDLSGQEIIRLVERFYIEDQENLDVRYSPISAPYTGQLMVKMAASITARAFAVSISSAEIERKSKLVIDLLAKGPKVEIVEVNAILATLRSAVITSTQLPFTTISSMVSIITTLFSENHITISDISDLVGPLVRLTWSYLDASYPKYHVEAVRHLWELQNALTISNRDIEAAICSLLTKNESFGNYTVCGADSGQRFAILWMHTVQENSSHLDQRLSKTSRSVWKSQEGGSKLGSYGVMLDRPLFLILDALADERTQSFFTARTWLHSLVRIDKLFYLLVERFTAIELLQHKLVPESGQSDGKDFHYTAEDDIDKCLYHIHTFSNILRWSSESLWTSLVENGVATDTSHAALYNITGREGELSLLEFFLRVCLKIIAGRCDPRYVDLAVRVNQLHRTALSTLHQILSAPHASHLVGLGLEDILIDRLFQSLNRSDPIIQSLLLDVVRSSLKLRTVLAPVVVAKMSPGLDQQHVSTQDLPQPHKQSHPVDHYDAHTNETTPPLPAVLIRCLQTGIAAKSSRPVLENWISLLIDCLPLYSDSIFHVIVPLVDTLCVEAERTFQIIRSFFETCSDAQPSDTVGETSFIALLNGLEHVLACGHDRLLGDEMRSPQVRVNDPPHGFFGNIVSGVFSSEAPQPKNSTTNNRLTVLLSFEDATRVCFKIWCWASQRATDLDINSSASFKYTSLRMRNRARRLLEHLFAAEALECLESVIEVWQKSLADGVRDPAVFNLLHVLDGSRPKHTIPAIFNAIYSRSDPHALEPSRKSTLKSSLNDTDLASFLVEYARSLDDDAMDEIWSDCMTFLRDLLTNPFPHRQTLPQLLEFAAILGEKVDNTNFGEQRRMRRELGDLFLRLLTAIFTTRPMGFSDGAADTDEGSKLAGRSNDVVAMLASITPKLPKILVEQDRVLLAANTISTGVTGPTFKSKSFPENVTKSMLVLLYQLSRLSSAQKAWRKDTSDAFNDPRFFATSFLLVESDWLPLLRQWSLNDKERIPELLSRLIPPTTAGIVFGVGATSARLDADRKTQLNLRRIATLVLAAADDNCIGDLPIILEKVVELLGATATSSPSSTTRADIYLLIRALVLKISCVHLAALWPIVNAELQTVISSVIAPDHSPLAELYNGASILQACRLLDFLICVAPDDFQLHEWLFVTDTIDAVYRPSSSEPTSLVDEISEQLGATAIASLSHFDQSRVTQSAEHHRRKPLIRPGGIWWDGNWERKDALVEKVLRPFFSQLSIFAFESIYSMGIPDLECCRAMLLQDLFDETTIVKGL